MIGIYKITNTINQKSYIGQSIDIERRFCDHRCISHESNKHLRYALKKYGKDVFLYEILEECSVEDLDEREIYYIKLLNPEYNVSLGGQGRKKQLPQSVKNVLSEKGKLQWENKSEEEKQFIIKNNLKGRRIGHKVSDETREKLRKANLGKKQSEETKKKRAESIKKLRDTKPQTNKSHRKKVMCVETNTIFESVKAAGESMGINPSSISANAKGRYKSCHGYHFKYMKV